MDENRTDAIGGLRKLADLLEAHPELPLPYHGFDVDLPMVLYMLGSSRSEFVDAVRALPGKANKRVENDTYRVGTNLDGLTVEVVAFRDDVCERVVTGTREVTKTIPDPMVTVPVVEVTEIVEDVEWVCSPLLGERATS